MLSLIVRLRVTLKSMMWLIYLKFTVGFNCNSWASSVNILNWGPNLLRKLEVVYVLIEILKSILLYSLQELTIVNLIWTFISMTVEEAHPSIEPLLSYQISLLRISWCRVHVTLPEKFWFTNPAILHWVPLILELSHMLVKVRLLLTHFWHQFCLLVLIKT